jgi:hypothetical protein
VFCILRHSFFCKKKEKKMNFLRRVWGSDQSRGFKITAWVTAIAIFGGISYYQSRQPVLQGDTMLPPERNQKNSKE